MGLSRRPGVLAPCFATRAQLSAERRRIARVRAEARTPPANDSGPRRFETRGLADGASSHFSDRGWTDPNGARMSNSTFVRGEHAGSDWLRDPEGEPND